MQVLKIQNDEDKGNFGFIKIKKEIAVRNPQAIEILGKLEMFIL